MRYVIISLIFYPLLLSITGCAVQNNYVKAYNEFAVESAKAGLWNEAALRWEYVITIEPDNAKAHNNLGVAYEALERLEDAYREYEIAVKLEPENEVYRKNLNQYQNQVKKATR